MPPIHTFFRLPAWKASSLGFSELLPLSCSQVICIVGKDEVKKVVIIKLSSAKRIKKTVYVLQAICKKKKKKERDLSSSKQK